MLNTQILSFLGISLFGIGLIGLLSRKNIFVSFMSIELMLNGLNILLAVFGIIHQSFDSFILIFFIMIVAACEAACGLAIIITFFRNYKSVNFKDLKRVFK